MKERPILFSGPMVRAILDGSKTQTRRVVKGIALDWLEPEVFTPEFVANPDNHLCPFGQPGDLLYVRETWAEGSRLHEGEWSDTIVYRADHDYADTRGWGWSSPRFMPKRHARLWLRVTDVRVERVQDISREDSIAEGIERVGGDLSCTPWRNYALGPDEPSAKNSASPIHSFSTLWDSINAKRAPWAENPWVWAITFEKVER